MDTVSQLLIVHTNAHTNLGSMRLINIKAFLEREEAMNKGQQVDLRCKVLAFRDDKSTAYAILSHRWIEDTEVDCEEMVGLARMDVERRDEIRQRRGYWKIWNTCQQAKKDGYEWVWVDTCCIDKRSSAELSEAINSMCRWYENSRVCYAYLHDVLVPTFPAQSDERRYPDSNGWPEWFSRGWTLQEMIAPSDVQFFNKDWRPIGDKEWLAEMLECITRVPQRVLTRGLTGNRPCVAQVMSWAANRTTTRVEDRAYSLMGLLDVNMPMLYGEGQKAFQRLQLEIIRSSNDQSIFAWLNWGGEWTGSILADDPRCFERCSQMELMDHAEFIESLKESIPVEELPLIQEDHFGTFPITNRGIHIWMLLDRCCNSNSVFKGILPCRFHSQAPPVQVNLALWNSNYYMYFSPVDFPSERNLQFRQIYLRYQDTFPGAVTFEIDDSLAVENGFTCPEKCPLEFKGNTLTVTGTNPLCARVYSNGQHDCRFAVAFGECFGEGWVHAITYPDELSQFYGQELLKRPEHARCMAEMPSRDDRYGRIWVNHIRLPGWIVRTSRVVWERSRIGVRIEAFRDLGINIGLNEWRTLDVQVGDSLIVYTILSLQLFIGFQ